MSSDGLPGRYPVHAAGDDPAFSWMSGAASCALTAWRRDAETGPAGWISCSYFKMFDGTCDHEHTDAEGHHRFDHHQQLGPPLDRGDIGGAERGGGPKGQRQVFHELREASEAARAYSVFSISGNTNAGFACGDGARAGGGATRDPDPSTTARTRSRWWTRSPRRSPADPVALVEKSLLLVRMSPTRRGWPGAQVRQCQQGDHSTGGDPQPGFLPVDAARRNPQ